MLAALLAAALLAPATAPLDIRADRLELDRKAGTARFTVFVAGDGSQVIETAKALDEAQKFRQQAIRDYLMHLPR